MTGAGDKAAGVTPAQLDGRAKFATEFGPLVAFGIGYFLHGRLAPLTDRLLGTEFFDGAGRELYLAVLFSLPAFAAALGYSVWKTRRVAPMLLVTAVLVSVLGALTFIFQSKTFIYMKPTIIYGITAAVLAGGLVSGRLFLKSLFDSAIDMPDAAWRHFTWRFVGFNVLTAIINEILWRTLTADCVPDMECAGDGTWVKIKLFGFTGAYLVFIMANLPFLMKHMRNEDDPEAKG
ncbi:MAG: inner membrane-spanning protein YciB [Pseudomonadota bacterium]